MEVNFNGANAGTEKGLQVFAKAQFFGSETEAKLKDLRNRVAGDNAEGNDVFATVSIALRPGFEDKHGIFDILNELIQMEAPIKPVLKFADGRLAIKLAA